MDVNGVEHIQLATVGGADAVTVDDLTGTGVTQVALDLSAMPGSGQGDGAADAVIVNGTAGDDTISVVSSVSQDAIIHDRPQDRGDDRDPGAQNESSEPKGQELSYGARISLDRGQMQIDDRLVNLSPGMAVTAEIKTGSRRILSYLLSPLLRYRQETLRER